MYPVLAGVSPAQQGAHQGQLAHRKNIEDTFFDTKIGVAPQAIDHPAATTVHRTDESTDDRTSGGARAQRQAAGHDVDRESGKSPRGGGLSGGGAELDQRLVALFAASDLERDPNELHAVGTLTRVHAFSKRPCCGKWVAKLEGLVRVRTSNYLREVPYREARVEYVLDSLEDSTLQQSLVLAVEQAVLRFRSLYPECHHTANAIGRLRAISEPSDVPGAVADLLLCVPVRERQQLLEMTSVTARLETILGHLHAFLASAGPTPAVH